MLSILYKRSNSKRLFYSSIFLIFIIFFMINYKSIYISWYIRNMSFNYTSKYPYLAVIVDDRASPLIVNAVLNVLQHIPADWKVQIITLEKNRAFYNKSSLQPFMNSNRVFLTSLQKSSNGLSSDTYINPILASASFWHQVQGAKVLLFQFDSVLCSNSSSTITDFLEYDFVGAPWYVGGCCNGGLSLRNRHKMLALLESGAVEFKLGTINEDGWFTENLPYFKGRVAPVSVARKFAVETIYHPRPFGIHSPHAATIGAENMKNLCNQCPEVKSVFDVCK